ncbi:hypothetical protein EJB05_39177, partial [Eragrostis curvula]
MDLRAYYIQAAEAAAAAIHAADDDDDDEVTELTPKAVLLKLEVQAGTADGAQVSRRGSCGLSPLGVGSAEAGMVVEERSGGRDLTCPECGKTFLSDRAMYGHLRSHPERGYKGATRPATAAVDGDKRPRKVLRKDAADESPATYTSAAVSKWPVTAKRGRASFAPSAGGASFVAAATQSSSSWCSEEEEAAMILLEMASRGGTVSETQQPAVKPAVRTRDAGHQMPDVEQQPMLLDDDHVAQNQTPELLQLMPPDDHVACAVAAHQQTLEDDSQQIFRLELSLRSCPRRGSRQEQHACEPGARRRRRRRRAKKHKKRRVLQDADRTPPGRTASPEAADAKPPTAARRIPSPASDKKHECTTCRKSFPTHQALGGHMSSHAKDAKLAARHDDDPAVVQAMRNILAHRKQKISSNAVGGGTGAAAERGVACASQEGTVLAVAGQQGAVLAGAGQEGQVGAVLAVAVQEHHDVEPPAPVPQSPPQHVCPECSMTFPSGQALGGHKRKHWYPEKKQAKADAALAAAPQNFDLNELPSEGDDENQP